MLTQSPSRARATGACRCRTASLCKCSMEPWCGTRSTEMRVWSLRREGGSQKERRKEQTDASSGAKGGPFGESPMFLNDAAHSLQSIRMPPRAESSVRPDSTPGDDKKSLTKRPWNPCRRHGPNTRSKHIWDTQSLITLLLSELLLHVTARGVSPRFMIVSYRGYLQYGMPSTHAKTSRQTCEDQNSLAIDGPGLVLVLLALSPFVPFLLAARLFGGLCASLKQGLHHCTMSNPCRQVPCLIRKFSMRLCACRVDTVKARNIDLTGGREGCRQRERERERERDEGEKTQKILRIRTTAKPCTQQDGPSIENVSFACCWTLWAHIT